MAKAQHTHNDCITGQSMLNGLQMNLKDAIEYAGAEVKKSDCLWQYPDIIRNNLIAKTITNINIVGKDIISVSREPNTDELIYNISSIYNTDNIDRPNYALNNKDWGKSMSIDEVFNDLFKNILPAVKGIHAGDMTSTDADGVDTKEWYNTLFNKTGKKTGLKPNSKYLRLYLTNQSEPIYIFINDIVNDLSQGYNVQNSDTVMLNVNTNTNTLTAHISCITDEQINSIK